MATINNRAGSGVMAAGMSGEEGWEDEICRIRKIQIEGLNLDIACSCERCRYCIDCNFIKLLIALSRKSKQGQRTIGNAGVAIPLPLPPT
jgi:hypothetical protein